MQEILMVRGIRCDQKPRRARLLFPFEKNGTILYLKSYTEEGLVLSRHKKINAMEKIYVRKRYNESIDLTNYVKGPGFLTTLFDPEEDEYTIRPSTMKELFTIGKEELIRCKNRDSVGHFAKNGSYVFGRKWMKDWMDTRQYVKGTVHFEEGKNFIDYEPVKYKDNIPNLRKSSSFKETFSFLLSESDIKSGRFSYPSIYKNRVGLERIKKGKAWKREDGHLILEPAPVKCAVCGKMISGYEGHQKICVSPKSLKNLKVIGRMMREAEKVSENPFQALSDDLQDLQKILNALN